MSTRIEEHPILGEPEKGKMISFGPGGNSESFGKRKFPEDLPELPDGGYSMGRYGASWKEPK